MAALIGISVKPKGAGGYICKVPLSALSEDGVPPEEGDSVSYSVDGTVQSVSGDDATVKIEAINGEPIGAESSEGSREPGAEGPDDSGGGGPDLASMRSKLASGAKGNSMPFM